MTTRSHDGKQPNRIQVLEDVEQVATLRDGSRLEGHVVAGHYVRADWRINRSFAAQLGDCP